MDEPSSGLDPLVQREFQAMMREVAAEGRAVFLSSHTLSEVQRVADRVGIIRHGRLIALESVASLRSKAMRTRRARVRRRPSTPAVFEAVPGVQRRRRSKTTAPCSRTTGKMEVAAQDRGGPLRRGRHHHPGGRPRRDLPHLLPRRGGDDLMLANVFTKTVRDRWKGEAIGVVTLGLLLLFGMSIYRDIDLAVYTDLPEVLRSLMNIPKDADVGEPRLRGDLRLVRGAHAGGAGHLDGLGFDRRRGTQGHASACCSAIRRVAPACSSSKAASMVVLTGAGSAGPVGRGTPGAVDARRQRGRNAGRGLRLPHVRHLPLLRLPGPGDRRLDREQRIWRLA